MTTYVVSEIEYWAMAPRIKIHYAGEDRDEALKIFEKHFRRNTWNTDEKKFFMLPPEVTKDLGKDPLFEQVVTWCVRKVEETGKLEIDDEWDDGEGDYPLYLQFTVRRE